MKNQLETIQKLRNMGASVVEMRGNTVVVVEFFEGSTQIGFQPQTAEEVQQLVNQEIENLRDEVQESTAKKRRDEATKTEKLKYGHAE